LARENFGGVGTARKLVEKTLAIDHINNFLLMRTLAVSVPGLWFYRCLYIHLQSTPLYVVIMNTELYGKAQQMERC